MLPVAFTSSPLTLHTAYSSGLQQCSKPMSEGVTKRNAGLLWEAFSYEQFSPDTSDAERGNDQHGQLRRLGPRIPSGGRVEVLWRGAFGMDAKRGAMGQGWPFATTLGTVPERGEFRVAKPGCRAHFLFGYFLFRASKEKRSAAE